MSQSAFTVAPSVVAVSQKDPLREWLLRWVLSGTETVVAFQRMCGITPTVEKKAASMESNPNSPTTQINNEFVIQNRLLHIFFLTAAAAGNELFYIVAFPCIFWCIDFALARRIAFLWSVIYFVGQSVKDLLRLPRPPSPPVTRLETHYETEYGFPSTHAMVSLVLPFYALCICADLNYNIDFQIGLIAAIIWCASITLSRLYVGVHSVCDLTGGLLLGALVLAFGYFVGPTVDAFEVHHPIAPAAALILSFISIWIYPAPLAWTNAYGDTALIIATAAGIACACTVWLPRHTVPVLNLSGQSSMEQFQSISAAILFKSFRMLIGCSVLFLTRFSVKKIATRIWLPFVLPRYFGWAAMLESPTHTENNDNHISENGTHSQGKNASVTPASSSTWTPDNVDADNSTMRHRKNGITPKCIDVAAASISLSAASTSDLDSSPPLISPQPHRPLPPAQFRLDASISRNKSTSPGHRSASTPPGIRIDELNSIIPPNNHSSSPAMTNLRVFLHSPSPQHKLALADAPSLASFNLDGKELIINPMHVYLCEIPIKYVTYFAVGFNAVCTCPIIFQWIGI
jgi:membrane-associated phospholipid phosphatase